MKTVNSLLATAVLLAASTPSVRANPEIAQAVEQGFGTTVAGGILLLKGSGTTAEPAEWLAYSRDAFRSRTLLRIHVKMEGIQWIASPGGTGNNILDRTPPRPLDFSRLRYRSADARMMAAKAAALAQTTFAVVDYQLAANAETGAPEWGLALKDETGYEVGFCVVSGETGALTFQDWTPRFSSREDNAGNDGERTARAVKRAARKAWNWTGNAGRETGNFFRELFR